MNSPSDWMEKFVARISPEPNSGCWLWTGDYHDKGYGQFEKTVRPRRAHRFAYEAFVGPIPEGMVIDHKCRVRCCVNPEHLEVVTPAENTRRGFVAREWKSTRSYDAPRTHCGRGHELSESNLRPFELKRGRRSCRLCSNIAASNYRLRRKASSV